MSSQNLPLCSKIYTTTAGLQEKREGLLAISPANGEMLARMIMQKV